MPEPSSSENSNPLLKVSGLEPSISTMTSSWDGWSCRTMRRPASPQKKARANRRGQSHMRFDHRTNLKGDRSGWCADRAAASIGRLVPRWRNLECESLQLSLQFIANYVSIIPHMLQLAQDHADMLLCKVAGAMTRKGYLYMVFQYLCSVFFPLSSLNPARRSHAV